MMVKILKSDIPVRSYVHLKFPLSKVRNWEINFLRSGFLSILEQHDFRNHQNYHNYELNFDFKLSQYILDISRITNVQKSQSREKKKGPEASHFDKPYHIC